MMQLEVRCCCQPDKLLGWIEYPRAPKAGECLVVTRRSEYGYATRFDPTHQSSVVPSPRIERFVFPIEVFCPAGCEPSYHAVKAEGRTMEELKELLQGFKFKPND